MICTFEATLSLSIERMTILVKGGVGCEKPHAIRPKKVILKQQ